MVVDVGQNQRGYSFFFLRISVAQIVREKIDHLGRGCSGKQKREKSDLVLIEEGAVPRGGCSG